MYCTVLYLPFRWSVEVIFFQHIPNRSTFSESEFETTIDQQNPVSHPSAPKPQSLQILSHRFSHDHEWCMSTGSSQIINFIQTLTFFTPTILSPITGSMALSFWCHHGCCPSLHSSLLRQYFLHLLSSIQTTTDPQQAINQLENISLTYASDPQIIMFSDLECESSSIIHTKTRKHQIKSLTIPIGFGYYLNF